MSDNAVRISETVENINGSKSRTFLGKVFNKQFPLIIDVVLIYSNTGERSSDKVVNDINKILLQFVLGTMLSKRGDFKNIFETLKLQFKDTRTVSFQYNLIIFNRRKRRK